MEETTKKISRHSPYRNSTPTPSDLKIKMSQFLWVGGRRVENSCPQINIWIQQLQIWTSNTTISMNPSLFSHPSQNYFSLAFILEYVSNSMQLSVISGPSWPYYSTAPKTQRLSYLSVDSPQHLKQVGSPPWSVSKTPFLLCLLGRSSPRLQLTANSHLPWIIVLNKLVKESGLGNYINKQLWEQNYRIYSNSKRYLHRKVFKTQYKNLLISKKKKKQKNSAKWSNTK